MDNSNMKMVLPAGTEQVTVLHGEAPKQHNPEPVKISGTITAPVDFMDARGSQVDVKKAHAIVSLSEGIIRLVLNEQDACNRYTITGKLDHNPLFDKLGINTGKKWAPRDLSEALRYARRYFNSAGDATETITALRNLKAAVDQKMSESSDNRGNRSNALDQVVETNLPESVCFHIPLLPGGEPMSLEVSLFVSLLEDKIRVEMDSVDLHENMDAAIERALEDEAKKLRKLGFAVITQA